MIRYNVQAVVYLLNAEWPAMRRHRGVTKGFLPSTKTPVSRADGFCVASSVAVLLNKLTTPP
jgi:hypothetical protein